LPAEGPITDRAVTNVLVAGLAGFLATADTHTGGAKDCPLYFNRPRHVSILTGPQKFDRDCRGKLAKNIPKELGPLEAMLEWGGSR
jgi:hypothetical protein